MQYLLKKTIGPSKSTKILLLSVSNNDKYSLKNTHKEKRYIRKVRPETRDPNGRTRDPTPEILMISGTQDPERETWDPYDK